LGGQLTKGVKQLPFEIGKFDRAHPLLTGRKTQRAASNLTTSLIEPYLDGLLWMSLQGEEA
jgi:hypothetical protein